MLTVTKDPDGENGLINIPISTICFLQYASHVSRVVVHTENEEYYLPGTLRYWIAVLNASGFCFYHAERNALINVEKVISIDRNFAYIYFNGEAQKRCPVAFYQIDKTAQNLSVLNSSINIIPAI